MTEFIELVRDYLQSRILLNPVDHRLGGNQLLSFSVSVFFLMLYLS